MPIDIHNPTSDHDLLITLHEQVKNIQEQLRQLTEGTSVKVLDHETRIRRLEYLGALAIGALAVLQILMKFWF